ncbi:EAL domain-containing protein [Virgibacillus doumboii]|uniref:EAL domain-containing protein n=1 Tax=Virgibacillus doumboii TaxID=2697503 RepID=UPI0013DE986D|nr:EAL domain-containing protein [Virgibacillus doumboii]
MNKDNLDRNDILDYYASLAMHHPDLIVIISPEGKVISQNKGSMNEFLGYSPDETIDHKEYLPKKSYHNLKYAFYEAMKGNTSRHEITLLNKYEQIIHAVVSAIPIKKADGDVKGVYFIVRDNTEHKQTMELLELHKSHLEHAQQISKIGSWEYLIDEDHLTCSDYFYDIFGYTQDESDTMAKLFEFVYPDDYDNAYNVVTKAIEKGVSYVCDFRIRHGETGELRYLKSQAEAVWKNNKPYKLVGVVKDYTTQQLLENKMEETKQNTKLLLDNLTVGFWMRNLSTGEMDYISNGAEELLGYPLQELYDMPDLWEKLIHPKDKEITLNRRELMMNGEIVRDYYRILCGDGTTKWVADQTIPWTNDSSKVTHSFGMLIDITAEMEMQHQLEYFSTHDQLTALPNQRSLYSKIDELCKSESGRNFALLYLDLDRFQLINDSLGYQIGDEVLKKVANGLLSAIAEGAYLARISSNDFIVVVEDYSTQEFIFQMAERIIESIEKTITVDEYELHVTTSIGISFFPEDGNDKLSLIESAHAALYRAKQLGKNNYQLYSSSKDITSFKKFVLERDMRKAIDNEEFEIYYQPQVETDTGVITGAEALIRWNHADWGLVSPGEFIPLAEENHLVHQIGEWVIENVCRQIRMWKDQGYNIRPISVNLSPIQFMKKGLVEFVAEQLSRNDLPAKYLELEITEGSLLKNEKVVLNTMEGLRGLGIKVAVDDFGTGYASMVYLREFNADTIKIDQIFIQNIANENDKDRAIISSVLHLAKGLGMKVIAEGVEEYDQLEFLKQKECDLIQGYLFSKPVPLETLEQMLQTGYLKPTKRKIEKAPEEERRNYYRLEFPSPVLGEMTIIEINKRKVSLGSADVLIEDIGLGGLKIVSSLKLPVNSEIKLNFKVELIGEEFQLNGHLAWKNEAKGDTFFYGIEFNITESEEDRLAAVINKMSVLLRANNDIPDTNFINQNPYAYIRKNHT